MTAVLPPGRAAPRRPRGRGGGSGRATGRVLVADAGDATLVSATVPAPSIDPMALVAAPSRRTRDRALAPPVGADGHRRRRARMGHGARRPGPLPRGRAAWARRWTVRASTGVGRMRRGAGPLLLGGLGFTGRDPPRTTRGAVRGQLAGAAGAAPGRDARRREAYGSLAGPVTPADVRGLERRWERLATRARALAPNPNGMVAMPVFATLATVDERPTQDGLAPAGRAVRRRGRARPARQGRAGAPRGPAVPGGLDVGNALRRLAASAPESTTFVFGAAVGPSWAPRPSGWSAPRAGPSGPSPSPARSAAGPDAAEDERCVAPSSRPTRTARSTRSWSSSLRELLRPVADSLTVAPEPGRADAARRPAPGHGDRGDGARRARAAGPGRAPPPDAGRGWRAARRGARAARRARGLRPRLVRRAGRLAGRRRRRRADGGAAVRDRGPRPTPRCSRAAASSPTPIRTASGRSRG